MRFLFRFDPGTGLPGAYTEGDLVQRLPDEGEWACIKPPIFAVVEVTDADAADVELLTSSLDGYTPDGEQPPPMLQRRRMYFDFSALPEQQYRQLLSSGTLTTRYPLLATCIRYRTE